MTDFNSMSFVSLGILWMTWLVNADAATDLLASLSVKLVNAVAWRWSFFSRFDDLIWKKNLIIFGRYTFVVDQLNGCSSVPFRLIGRNSFVLFTADFTLLLVLLIKIVIRAVKIQVYSQCTFVVQKLFVYLIILASCSNEFVEEAKFIINQALMDLMDNYQSFGIADEIYQLNLQLYPVTKL